ncbi:hypothetical protein JOB18_048129 [Solea senegalensis]|uniref:Uncharacterized protein n=1 Tax=Solea senegalensis TaxID=28829 RepID=A0AAV6T263_SOLSE|nr:hypothetical protein JOB18_048129 [Solea senegalensis]
MNDEVEDCPAEFTTEGESPRPFKRWILTMSTLRHYLEIRQPPGESLENVTIFIICGESQECGTCLKAVFVRAGYGLKHLKDKILMVSVKFVNTFSLVIDKEFCLYC